MKWHDVLRCTAYKEQRELAAGVYYGTLVAYHPDVVMSRIVQPPRPMTNGEGHWRVTFGCIMGPDPAKADAAALEDWTFDTYEAFRAFFDAAISAKKEIDEEEVEN